MQARPILQHQRRKGAKPHQKGEIMSIQLDQLSVSLRVMGLGMLGIFIVMSIVYLATLSISKILKENKK
jgi:hypothetical protein